MSRFDRLIESSENALKVENSFVNKFKYPGLFVISLKELRDLIGNETIKDSIASQIMYLISTRDDIKNVNSSPVMMNTLLYGPPGTGKTAIASKLAKIYYAMGVLKNGNVLKSTESLLNPEYIAIGVYILIYGYVVILAITKIFSNIVEYIGLKYIMLIFIVIMLLVVMVIYINNKDYANKVNSMAVKDSDIITIVSREDFIDKYLGGTDKKTKTLLMANMGKVLFIDEAYSLYNGDHDPYGMEALTTLNRFLSENSDNIFVIMAGYKDLIRDKIFTNQPGLKSRFMWHFECNGYDDDELYRIFLLMLKNEGWKLVKEHKPQLRELITSNVSNFKSFARDIQRLIFFSQLEYSESFTMNNNTNKKELTIDMIERAMKIFIDNDIDNDIDNKSSVNQTDDSLISLLKIMNDNPAITNASTTDKITKSNVEADSFRLGSSDIASEDFYDRRRDSNILYHETKNVDNTLSQDNKSGILLERLLLDNI